MYHIDVSQMHFQTNQRGDPFDISIVLYKQHFRTSQRAATDLTQKLVGDKKISFHAWMDEVAKKATSLDKQMDNLRKI